jgi:hypothetical protein
MKVFARIGLLITILIVGSVTMCSFHKRTVYADPNVAPAFARVKNDGQPLIDALAHFYATHAYYPRSVSELPLNPYLLHGVRYEVWSMNRVYKTLECSGRAKEFTGFVGAISDYERKLEDFRVECVRGYSNFLIKSEPIAPAWSVNRHLTIFAQFSSQEDRWSVDWCSPPQHPTRGSGPDCSHNAFDETLPPGPYTTVQQPARALITTPSSR